MFKNSVDDEITMTSIEQNAVARTRPIISAATSKTMKFISTGHRQNVRVRSRPTEADVLHHTTRKNTSVLH